MIILLLCLSAGYSLYSLTHQHVQKLTTTYSPSGNNQTSTTQSITLTNQTASTISSLGNPMIQSFVIKKLPAKGLAEVIVNASDISGIAKVLLELNGKNVSMIRFSNDLYTYNISMGEDPVILPIKIYVLDPYNQTASTASEIHWLLQDAFTYYSVDHDFGAFEVQNFYEQYKDLIERFYITNKSELMLPLHVYDVNATLLGLAKQKVYADSQVADKAMIFLELSKALYNLNEKSLSGVSLAYLGNLTAFKRCDPIKVFNRSALWNVLNLTEKFPIIIIGLGKKQPIEYGETLILTYIVNNNLNYAKAYPYATWALTKQTSVIDKWLGIKYNQAFDINGTKYTMNAVVNKDFTTIAKYTREEKMLLGLNPDDFIYQRGYISLPKPVNSSYLVGAYYWVMWNTAYPLGHFMDWRDSIYTPIGGKYNSTDTRVIDWQIKWAVEHGVNFLAVQFYESQLREGFINASYLRYIKFAFIAPKALQLNIVKYDFIHQIDWMSKYFSNPSYLKVNDRPVIFLLIYPSWVTDEEQKLVDLMTEAKSYIKSKGINPYIIGVYSIPDGNYNKTYLSLTKLFDAVTVYNMPNIGGAKAPYETLLQSYINAYNEWETQLSKERIAYVPNILPGFNNTLSYAHGTREWLVVRGDATPEQFTKMCLEAKKHTDSKLRMVMITAWNEYAEGSVIEPTLDKGFQYLDIIKEVFTESSSTTEYIDTPILWEDTNKNRVIVDNWMRQKVLPQALFYTIWDKAIFAWDKYPTEFASEGSGPVSPRFNVLKPSIALKIAIDNLNYFDEGHASVVEIINNLDKPLAYGWSVKKWIKNYAEQEFWNHFPQTKNESYKDIWFLIDKGSKIVKANLYIYGKSLSDRVQSALNDKAHNYTHWEEERVEQAILNAWSVGLPIYRSFTAYPDKPGWIHDEPSFTITLSDISLLYQRSSEKLLLNDKTYTLNFLSTRKSAVIKDKVPYCNIFLPDLTLYVYYKKSS